jgi:hypothetical protein
MVPRFAIADPPLERKNANRRDAGAREYDVGGLKCRPCRAFADLSFAPVAAPWKIATSLRLDASQETLSKCVSDASNSLVSPEEDFNGGPALSERLRGAIWGEFVGGSTNP